MATFGSGVHDDLFGTGLTADFKYAHVYSATASGDIATAYVWAAGQGLTAHIKFFVYATSAGSPTTLLGTSDALTLLGSAPFALQTFTFSTPVSVTSSTSYALGIITDQNFACGYHTEPGATYYYSADAYSNGASSPFGPSSATGTRFTFEADIGDPAGTRAAPFIAATGSVFVPTLVHTGQVEAPFIASTASVYAASFSGAGTATLTAPFIASTTSVFTPVVSRFTAPFIASTAVVYAPTLRRVGTGVQPVGVSIGFDDPVTENAPTWSRLDA